MDSGLGPFHLKYQASLFSFDTSKWHLLAIVDLLRSAKFKVGKKSVHREFLIFDRNFAKIKIKGGKKNKIAKLRKIGSDASSDKKISKMIFEVDRK